MRESEIEKRVGREVRKAGGLYYKFTSPGNAGVPDRLVIMPGGKIRFVELKAENGEASKLQKRQIAKLKALGCDVRVVRGALEADKFVREVTGL